MEWEECFYGCDPWAAEYEDPDNAAYLKNLPVCSTMCNDWFEACKYDYTCVDNFLELPFINGSYTCTSPCRVSRARVARCARGGVGSECCSRNEAQHPIHS